MGDGRSGFFLIVVVVVVVVVAVDVLLLLSLALLFLVLFGLDFLILFQGGERACVNVPLLFFLCCVV